MSRCSKARSGLVALGLVALSCVGGLWAAAPASAHVDLSGSVPASGATVAKSPTQVELRFSGPVDATASQTGVKDSSGKSVDTSKAFPLSGSNNSLGVSTSSTSTGVHKVSWKVVAADGHAMTGTYTYTVGATTGAATPNAAQPMTPNAGQAGPTNGGAQSIGDVATTGAAPKATMPPKGTVILTPKNATSEASNANRALVPALILSIFVGSLLGAGFRRLA